MKLTIKKLESLIQEMIGRNFNKFSHEQEKKIVTLIKKTRELLREIETIMGFYPPLVNDLYADEDKIQYKLRRITSDPFYKPYVMAHYNAVRKIAENLEVVNQYIVLLEDLEIEGNIAFIAKGMLYNDEKVIITGTGKIVPFLNLVDIYDLSTSFLENIQNFDPSFFGGGTLNFEAMRDIVSSFHNNYSDLKDYLERVVWN